MDMRINKLNALLILLVMPSIACANYRLHDRFFANFAYERVSLKSRKHIRLGEDVPDAQSNFMKSQTGAYNFILGYRSESIAFRIGYTYLQNIDYYPTLYRPDTPEIGSGFMRQRGDNYFIDGIYHMPINSLTEFMGLLGVGILRTKLTTTLQTGDYIGYYFDENYEPGVRLGAGFQRQFTKNLVADILFKLQYPGNRTFKYMMGLSIGLSWYI